MLIPSTGLIKFSGSHPGVYIAGNEAEGYKRAIQQALGEDSCLGIIERLALGALLTLLSSCKDHPDHTEGVAQLRSFGQCQIQAISTL